MKVEVHRVGEQRPRCGPPLRFWLWVVAIAFAAGLTVAGLVFAAFFLLGIGAVVMAVLVGAAYLGDLRRRLSDWWHGGSPMQKK